MKAISIAVLLVIALVTGTDAGTRPPNIVMFVVDDMCDWIGPMGDTQALTPHMDRLAANGVTFRNAHTAGVFCAPSRTALFTGRHSSTTGCYTTQVYAHQSPEVTPLQMVLQEGGYATHGAGKLFHHPAGYVDLRGWNEFFVRDQGQKQRGWPLESWTLDDPALPDPYPSSIFNHDREPANKFFMEWGKVRNENEEKMADTIRTEWACDLLRKKHELPVFVAVGLYAPHFPNYAPEKYFDLYDPAKIKLPPYKTDDLEDLPPRVRKAKENRGAHHRRLESLDAVDDAIHGYLACISYADAMLGRVLDAIESGPNADNTVVVLWSDHGSHHGEKLDWGKHTLWERTSNVPFIWAGPGIAKGVAIDATVSLIDVFPTLTGLAGVKDGLPRDGLSLAPVLQDPSRAKDRDVLMPGMKPEEYAIMNRDWRYIRYADGTEELYHVKQDPHEWKNLAGNPEFDGAKEKLRAAAPSTFAAPGPTSAQLKLVIEDDGFRWEPRNAARRKVKAVPGKGVGMTPLKQSPEARTMPVKVRGRPAWKTALRPGKPSFFFFTLNEEAERHGKQPSVQVALTYLDEGNTPVVVQYDSSDPHVNKSHPLGAGVFKEAFRFKTGDSGKWKTAVFNLDDAYFAGRCNGCDLRVVFPNPETEPIIAEALVKPRR